MGFSENSSDDTDLGDEWDDNGPNTVNDAAVTANANIPYWTTSLTDITMDPLLRIVVPVNLKTLKFLWQQY